MLEIELRDSCTARSIRYSTKGDTSIASLPSTSLAREKLSRVELSLSGRVVTIGTLATLAYLHDAACKGCERGVRAKEERERETKQMDTERYMRDLLMGREKAFTIRNANR